MQLTLDNLDGLGPVDYSAAIDNSQPLVIERNLNAPSVAKGLLCLVGSALAVPVRRARIVISTSAGMVLFTGYLATEAEPVYAGVDSRGPVYRYAFSGVSDEWLLDKQTAGAPIGRSLGVLSSAALQSLAGRYLAPSGAPLLSTSGLISTGATRSIGYFAPEAGRPFSAAAGSLAAAGYSSYRALGGALTLAPVNSVIHTLSDGDGSLQMAGLKTASVRELANDVTLTGEDEAGTYWTELFAGDGTTAVFNLLGEPAAPKAGHSALVSEGFSLGVLNQQLWQVNDAGAYLGLGAAGLTLLGGNGLDGQTTLTALNPVELGGTLLLELANVQLAAGSVGILGGVYSGVTSQANCFAGFSIRTVLGQTIATPLVNGVETGTSLPILAGHAYTLRLRLHSPEVVRQLQSYYALVAGSAGAQVEAFGGGLVNAPASMVFEARDLGASSNTPVSVLYDGSVALSPAFANLVAVNSVGLVGSLGGVYLNDTGSCWIRSTSATGTQWTRLAGVATDGVDCALTSSAQGKVTFFPGRIPAAGETIAVSYRGRRRAVARLADPASLAAEAAGGAVGTARWIGHVVRPQARCAEDCESAAQAVLSFSTSRAAATSGTYVAVNPPLAGSDLWPGDVLALSTAGGTLSVIARRVTVSSQGDAPEALTYHVSFANDWAEGLGMKLSEALPKDALLPTSALNLVDSTTGGQPSVPAHVLVSLQQVTVAGPTGGFLTVDAGLAPPAGGGFEVRRYDGGFGSGVGPSNSGDLVLRSPVRGFAIPISAADERFFIRMYDGSTPALYSRRSAALLLHGIGG